MTAIATRLPIRYGERVSLVIPPRENRVWLGAVVHIVLGRSQANSDYYALVSGGGYIIRYFVEMSRLRVAWTIVKLKYTTALFRFFMRIHVWWLLRQELKNQRKVQPSYKTGQRTREEVRKAVAKIKKGRYEK